MFATATQKIQLKTRLSKQCEFCNYLLDKSLITQGCQSGSICQSGPGGLVVQGGPGYPGGPGCPDGPGCPGCPDLQCGPGGLGCLGGPGDQVCQCIWFTWSTQSNYRENLRCHACDILTDMGK